MHLLLTNRRNSRIYFRFALRCRLLRGRLPFACCRRLVWSRISRPPCATRCRIGFDLPALPSPRCARRCFDRHALRTYGFFTFRTRMWRRLTTHKLLIGPRTGLVRCIGLNRCRRLGRPLGGRCQYRRLDTSSCPSRFRIISNHRDWRGGRRVGHKPTSTNGEGYLWAIYCLIELWTASNGCDWHSCRSFQCWLISVYRQRRSRTCRHLVSLRPHLRI